MKLPGYHESFEHLHVNTLPNHAYFIPFGSRETALCGERTGSERFFLLSGKWSFRYYESLLDVPQEIIEQPMSETTIPVPSVWQCLRTVFPQLRLGVSGAGKGHSVL